MMMRGRRVTVAVDSDALSSHFHRRSRQQQARLGLPRPSPPSNRRLIPPRTQPCIRLNIQQPHPLNSQLVVQPNPRLYTQRLTPHRRRPYTRHFIPPCTRRGSLHPSLHRFQLLHLPTQPCTRRPNRRHTQLLCLPTPQPSTRPQDPHATQPCSRTHF